MKETFLVGVHFKRNDDPERCLQIITQGKPPIKEFGEED
jgi:hypothetical protein